MPTQVQIDGIGTVELDDSFKGKSPSEQQGIIEGIASQHAAQAGPAANQFPAGDSRNLPAALTVTPDLPRVPRQPTMTDQIAGSPLGRFVHDAVVQPVKGALTQAANMLPAAASVISNPLSAFDGTASTLAKSGFTPATDAANNAVEQPYQDALAANRNTPGYAAARAQADKSLAARGGPSFMGNVGGAVLPTVAGISGGLFGGSLDASNAAADAQTAGQQSFTQQHPILGAAASLTGGLMLGPSGSRMPIYAGDAAAVTRLAHGPTTGPFPVNPASRPLAMPPLNLPQLTPQAAQRATSYVSDLMRSAGKTPADVAQVASAANGKPMLGAEAIGQPAQVGLAALGRREGLTGDALQGSLDERSAGTPDRVLADYAAASGVDPAAARGDLQTLVANGRQAARPLYTKAFSGGSTAPLQSQLEGHFADAVSAERAARDQIQQANQAMTIAKAKQSGTNNVYQMNGALEAERAAQAQIDAATQAHDQASQNKEMVLDKLRQSQGDAANNVRGGVWSPRLQQFLNDPILKSGLGRGLELERLDALAAGKPFNPTEYGVTGTAEDGSPIVSNVPNMRLLDAGKRGLDTMLTEQYAHPITGKVNLLDPRAAAIDRVRRSYVSELDSLNPDYAAARGTAGDYLSAQSSFENGGKMVLNGNLPAADFAQHFQGLSSADQEAFKGGIANKLFNHAQNGSLSLKLFNRPIVQQKLAAVLGPKNAASFLSNVKTEAQLSQNAARMRPGSGSGTAELNAAMDSQDGVNPALGAVIDTGQNMLSHGFVRGAIKTVGQYARNPIANLRAGAMPIPVRDASGALLMLPGKDLAAHLARSAVPPSRALQLPRLPADGPRPYGLFGSMAGSKPSNGNQ